MASTNEIILTDTTVITGNGTTTSDPKQVNSNNKEIFAVLSVTCYCDGTYDTIIEHSIDGTNFVETALVTIPQANAEEVQAIAFPVTGHLLYIRAVTTAASVTSGATIKVALYTEKKRRT